MNNRIRELAVQACDIMPLYDSINRGDYTHSQYNRQIELLLERFAELIVKEMCNVLDKEQWNIGRDWICDDGTRIIPKVKEHFGVEE